MVCPSIFAETALPKGQYSCGRLFYFSQFLGMKSTRKGVKWASSAIATCGKWIIPIPAKIKLCTTFRKSEAPYLTITMQKMLTEHLMNIATSRLVLPYKQQNRMY